VTFKLLNFEDGNGDIMIKVHDTGTGMEQSFLEKIFRPFEQENVDVTKKHGGSGLGMTITNRLVTLMNGKIEIDTKVGRGTDFSVYLTLPAADGYDAVEHNDVGESDGSFSYEGLRILLAEDNNINAEIAVEILEADGAMLERAADGRQAVDMYQKHCSGYYDLILMDVQMPVTDGWTAAVRIRHSGKEDSEDIPIYALSADAFIEDKRKSYRCGMNGHFSKPIDFGTLKKGIEADFRRRGRL
jgi:CheY-like chemotaxis protein